MTSLNSTPKRIADSVCIMTELVLPSHANALGSVFGGMIMSWVDSCAAIAAQRHAGQTVVTAFVDDLWFQAPVRVGEVVQLEARVSAAFRTSVEVEVIVHGEEPTTRRTWPCVKARLTFVALNEQGKPTPIPPILFETEEERQRQRDAEERRTLRLARKHC